MPFTDRRDLLGPQLVEVSEGVVTVYPCRPMTTFIKALFHRRVPQVAMVYAGILWGLVQFADFASSRYHLPERTVDWVFFGLLGVLPAVLLIAWNHGAPGRDQWTRREVAFALCNLVLVGLGLYFFGPNSGANPSPAPTAAVGASQESGDQARQKLSKTLLFLFTPPTDNSLYYAAYALPSLLQIDLSQDDQLNVETALDGYQRPYLARLKRAGFGDGVGAPVRLLSEIADDVGAQFFVTGSVAPDPAGFAANVEIYTVRPARLKRKADVRAADLNALADEISVQIRNAMAAPDSAQDAIADDLPVASLTSDSPAAIAAWGNGIRAWAVNNDSAAAAVAFGEAIALDKTFALAHLALTEALFFGGQTAAAINAAKAAQAVQFRLSDGDRYLLRSYLAALTGRPAEATQMLQTWATAKPFDLDAKTALAFDYLTRTGEPKRALAEFQAIAELDPGNPWARMFAVRLQRQVGGEQKALALMQAFADADPQRPSAWVELAELQWQSGDIAGAKSSFEHALPLRGDVVSPLLSYSSFLLSQGDFDRAGSLIDDARQIARDAQQRALVIAAEINLLRMRGELAPAVTKLSELIVEQRQYLSVYELNGTLIEWADLVAEANGTEAALAWIDQTMVSTQANDPFNAIFVATAGLNVANQTRDRNLINAALTGLQRLVQANPSGGAFMGQSLMLYSQAKISELDGDLVQALKLYQQGRERFRAAIGALSTPVTVEISFGVAIARIARLTGDTELAKSERERVALIAPKAPEVEAEVRAAAL